MWALLKKYGVQSGISCVIFLVFLANAVGWIALPGMQQVERGLYDKRVNLALTGGVDPRIVIVDIDEASLAQVGHWPWNRTVLARLIDQLYDHYHVAVTGFDVVFAERDNSGLNALDRLEQSALASDAQFQALKPQLHDQLDYDATFVRSLRNRSVVLGYYFSDDEKHSTGALPPPTLPKGYFEGSEVYPVSRSSFGGNLPELTTAASSAGHFNPEVDDDGKVRKISMLIEHDGAYYEPLSLAMVRNYLAAQHGEMSVRAIHPEDFGGQKFKNVIALQVGPYQIPVDKNMWAKIPFRGGEGSFHYISAKDVLFGTANIADLKGKFVLLGTSAPGLKDQRVSPTDSVYNGVEFHANMIAGILDQSIPVTPDYMPAVQTLVLAACALLILWMMVKLSPLLASAGVLVLLAISGGANLWLWSHEHIDMPYGSILVMVVLQFVAITIYGYFFETRRKREMANLFGQYVPPELVERMSADPTAYSMEGQKKEITVLFSDVRGFTSISESMDPKELVKLINEFLTALSKVIGKDYMGTIDKYMGDCVMAFWNAPVSDPQHAQHAVHAGLAMQKAMQDLQPVFQERGWPPIHIGVGVNTGHDITVGDMGSNIRRAYTVMGDAVNLASRLEGITKRYGVGMIVGQDTKTKVDDVLFRELDRVRVKGKGEPVTIFEPVALLTDVQKPTLKAVDMFHQALRYYRAQDWDMAELQLLNLQAQQPHPLYEVYLGRIADFRKTPPGPDWDAVFEFDSK